MAKARSATAASFCPLRGNSGARAGPAVRAGVARQRDGRHRDRPLDFADAAGRHRRRVVQLHRLRAQRAAPLSASPSTLTYGSPIASRSSRRFAARTSIPLHPYALYVRVRPWRDRPIDIQAGRIPPTFGAFARRDYGAGNPLIGYPLAYQYLTAARPDALPASTDDVLRMRARGWRPSYPIGSLDIAPGMPLITAFRWDTGVQVRVGPESINASAAVTNGTTSDPRTRDNNGGKQIAGRLHWRPSAAFAIGGSAATGAYVADAALANATVIGGTARSKQHAFGLDAEYSRDHWIVRGEFIWNRWQVPTLSADARRDERVRRRALQDLAWLIRGEPHRSPRLQRARVIVLRNAHVGRAHHASRDRRRLSTSAATCSRRAPISTIGATADLSGAAGCSRRSCISGCERDAVCPVPSAFCSVSGALHLRSLCAGADRHYPRPRRRETPPAHSGAPSERQRPRHARPPRRARPAAVGRLSRVGAGARVSRSGAAARDDGSAERNVRSTRARDYGRHHRRLSRTATRSITTCFRCAPRGSISAGTPRAARNPSASIAPASSACSAKSTRT